MSSSRSATRARTARFAACNLQVLHLPSWETLAKVSIQDATIHWNAQIMERLGLDVDINGRITEHDQEPGNVTPRPDAAQESPPTSTTATSGKSMGTGRSARKKGKGGKGSGCSPPAETRAMEVDLEEELRAEDEEANNRADERGRPPAMTAPIAMCEISPRHRYMECESTKSPTPTGGFK